MTKEPMLLKLLRKGDRVWSAMGINTRHYYAILKLKLTMDDRRNNLSNKKMSVAKANLIVQIMIGIFMAIMMFLPFDLFYRVTMIAAMDMFFMIMYMISDFSGVLLDVRDKDIIMTKGVDNKTMNVARITHVTYYLLIMFFALNGPSMVVGTLKDGPMMILAFLILLVLMSFLVIFLTTILYSILLERFSGEKLKDIINTFQVILSIVTVISYQLVGRIFEFVDLSLKVTIHWWTYLLPPVWYSSLFKILVEGDVKTSYVVMSLIGIIVPILMAVSFFKVIMPRYEGYLAKLQIEDGVFIGKESKIKEGLFSLLSKDHVEKAFIRFADANLSRDRKLKLMIYPNYALGFIFPFIMMLSLLRSGGFEGMRTGYNYLFSYLSVVLFVTNYQFVQFSECHAASFIYDSFPIEDKSVILRGAVKAYFIKYVLPGMALLSLIFTLLMGIKVLPSMILISVFSYVFLALKVKISTPQLPFSKEPNSVGNQDVGATFLLMFIAGAAAGLHFALIKFMYPAVFLVIIVMIILAKLIFDQAVSFKKGLEKTA